MRRSGPLTVALRSSLCNFSAPKAGLKPSEPNCELMISSFLESDLQGCKNQKQLNPMLAQFIVTGLVHQTLSLCKFVKFLALSNDPAFLMSARLLVDQSEHPNSFLCNTLIRGYAQSKFPEEAIKIYCEMLRKALPPDNFTFPFLVKASATRTSIGEGKQIHDQIVKNGFDSDVFAINTLLNMYSICGDMDSASTLFDNSTRLDIVSWNTMIDGYVKSGSVELARQLFDKMSERNEITWSTMISGYTRDGELGVARSLFDRMPVQRSTVTWNSMIYGFGKSGLLPLARQLFDEMPARNIISWNSMITGCIQSGEIDSARQLFDEMPHRDVVSWSSMISGYAQSNRCRDALKLFHEMQVKNSTKPNEITLVSVLSVCAQLAALDQGKWIHAYIKKNNMKLSDNLGAALVDMYSKCGQIDSAMEVFWKLDHRNVSAWNALITGFAINGVADRSLEAFTQMQNSEIKPNDITFMGVLMACSHGGLVEQGRQYFEKMSKVYGIKTQIKHYGCMVDLLGRAGLLEEAEEMIKSMPMKPDVMILGALLGACRIHGNAEVADRLRKDFLELKCRQAGCHVLLSNIYATAGRWHDALEARSLLKKKGIKKVPGSSSIELDGTVYEFVAGDISNPRTNEIYSWLDETGKKLRSEGYLPVVADVLLDLDEEDKETWLYRHSEKLAVAFAMISAGPESSIRIVKNLRICSDCHLFVKLVSKFCSREILVRDRNRFHHFRDGFCSCRDYW